MLTELSVLTIHFRPLLPIGLFGSAGIKNSLKHRMKFMKEGFQISKHPFTASIPRRDRISFHWWVFWEFSYGWSCCHCCCGFFGDFFVFVFSTLSMDSDVHLWTIPKGDVVKLKRVWITFYVGKILLLLQREMHIISEWQDYLFSSAMVKLRTSMKQFPLLWKSQ